jgi:hypothetical protein
MFTKRTFPTIQPWFFKTEFGKKKWRRFNPTWFKEYGDWLEYYIGLFIGDIALILPVATLTVERAFSAMNIIKNRLRNKIEDRWMINDCLVTYIEKYIFKTISNEKIMQRFQGMKTRRWQLN